MDSKTIRNVLEDTFQVKIQVKVLEELKKGKLTSVKLKEFVESLGGDYYFILPLLKRSGMLKTQQISRQDGTYLYSLADTRKEIIPEWWKELVSDCRMLINEAQEIVSTIKNNNHTIISLKHQLGKRILRNKRRYKKYKFGSGEYIYDLAYELEVSEATIRDAIKFASKFPYLVTFHKDYESEDKKLTWSFIKNNLLYNHKSSKNRKSVNSESRIYHS